MTEQMCIIFAASFTLRGGDTHIEKVSKILILNANTVNIKQIFLNQKNYRDFRERSPWFQLFKARVDIKGKPITLSIFLLVPVNEKAILNAILRLEAADTLWFITFIYSKNHQSYNFQYLSYFRLQFLQTLEQNKQCKLISQKGILKRNFSYSRYLFEFLCYFILRFQRYG